MSTGASIKHTVENFDGVNFNLWRHCIKMVLMAKNIGYVVQTAPTQYKNKNAAVQGAVTKYNTDSQIALA